MDRGDRGASAWADHHQCSAVDDKNRTAWLLFTVCSLCNVRQQEPSACLGGVSYTAHRVHPWISQYRILFRFYRRQLVTLYKVADWRTHMDFAGSDYWRPYRGWLRLLAILLLAW